MFPSIRRCLRLRRLFRLRSLRSLPVGRLSLRSLPAKRRTRMYPVLFLPSVGLLPGGPQIPPWPLLLRIRFLLLYYEGSCIAPMLKMRPFSSLLVFFYAVLLLNLDVVECSGHFAIFQNYAGHEFCLALLHCAWCVEIWEVCVDKCCLFCWCDSMECIKA